MRCLSLHVTDLCNSRCSFCVVGTPDVRSDSVQFDDMVRFLEQNRGLGYDIVNLHGGEPTVNPRLIELVALIRKLGYAEVHLQTNGIRLSDPAFTAELVRLGVRLFIISLHGHTGEVQDKLTGTPGGFARTLQGIGHAAARARVRTNTVITRSNVARLPEIVSLACRLGVQHINLSNLHPAGTALHHLEALIPPFAEIRGPLYAAVDLALQEGRRVTLEGFPYCTVKERSDLHLANDYRDIRMLYRNTVIDYERFMNHNMRVFGAPCAACSRRDPCGGVYSDYVAFRGWDEFAPIVAELEPVHG